MYAIVRTGGKQYKVKAGDQIRVELLEKSKGDEFNMEEVLFVGGEKSYLGEPIVSDAKVKVLVTRQGEKAKKIVIFKKKRRHGYRKTQGHRQLFTELLVKAITAPDGESVIADSNKEFEATKSYESEIENHLSSVQEQTEPTEMEKDKDSDRD